MRFRKAAIVVLDGVGAGEAHDAAAFGDEGSDTLGNTAEAVGGLELPHFEALGLGNAVRMRGVHATLDPRASFGRMRETSAGKDTTSGHWEISGLEVSRPMPTYPDGFPPEVLHAFERITGRSALGNEVASGTEIIARLGVEHQESARPIVYTSADSVFQVAAHEETVPLTELYRWCEEARALLRGPHAVGRVIARPFVGEPGAYSRTNNRKDFSLEPDGVTVLDLLAAAGHEVAAVGKIDDIFARRGITRSAHVLPNMDCVDETIRALREIDTGLVFTNLIEFDMNFGHRNDPEGMASALRELDARVPELLEAAGSETLLVFTADHGNDPTTASTDHSREEVPLLVWAGGAVGVDLGTRATFADVGATVAENFGLEGLAYGTSFLADLARRAGKDDNPAMTEAEREELVQTARQAAESAYAPYSDYRVGAALLTASGEIVSGCNVENASFGLSICAERNAVFAARARNLLDPESHPIRAVAIHAPSGTMPWPCGACRQVLNEFAGPAIPVFVQGQGDIVESTLGELIPKAFFLGK